jgi:hypothetical protein
MNQNMVRYGIEHATDNERICPICHDDENPITKDNILVLNCIHTFHMECGIKSLLIEDDMTCPICRNLQDFGWGKDEVYFPVVSYIIDHGIEKMILKFLDMNDMRYNHYMIEHTILTENIDMLELIEQYILHEEHDNDHILEVYIPKLIFTIRNKKYNVMEYYANGDKQRRDALLFHAVMQSDLYAIMCLIYKFDADINKEYDDLSLLCYAIRTHSIEIVSYLLHDCRMDVHANDNCSIKDALDEGGYDIQKLCLENIVDPNHSDNIGNEHDYKNKIINVRALIIEHAMKKVGNRMFSRIICNTSINDKNVPELFEFFYEKINLVNKSDEDDGQWYELNSTTHSSYNIIYHHS